MNRRDRLAAKFAEHLPSRGFYMGNGMFLCYHPKVEEIVISNDRGMVVGFDRVDVALLRRLLETIGEFSVPDSNPRYQNELAGILKDGV